MIRFCFIILSVVALMQLCSCATAAHEPTEMAAANLPAEGEIKKFKSSSFAVPLVEVTLHLEDGTEFKCIVDTGSPCCILPKTVEPQLGKRLGNSKIKTAERWEKLTVYHTPTIYLGDTPLARGNDRIGVWNYPEGIIGMNCLRHYCIQFDFQNGKMRFLKSGDPNAAEWGKAFPLTSLQYAYIRQDGFFGQKDLQLMVDTGDPIDGMMNPKLLQQAIQEQKAQRMPLKVFGEYKGKIPQLVSIPTCVWSGETYTNLVVEGGRPNIIGLKFLARHQVTFDFPKKVMYLKYLSEGSAPIQGSP